MLTGGSHDLELIDLDDLVLVALEIEDRPVDAGVGDDDDPVSATDCELRVHFSLEWSACQKKVFDY